MTSDGTCERGTWGVPTRQRAPQETEKIPPTTAALLWALGFGFVISCLLLAGVVQDEGGEWALRGRGQLGHQAPPSGGRGGGQEPPAPRRAGATPTAGGANRGPGGTEIKNE
jgi:hypothetical protein